MRRLVCSVVSASLVAFGASRCALADSTAGASSAQVDTPAATVPTRAHLRVEGGNALVYRDKRLSPVAGPITEWDVLVFRDSPARLSLRFDRPVETTSVTAALERSVQGQARLIVTWPRPDFARLQLEWDRRLPGQWREIVLRDPDGPPALDARGHRIEFRLPLIELHQVARFRRWRPAGNDHVGAVAPPRVTVFTHDGAVAGNRVLLEHFAEEVGDYRLHVPVLVDIETGALHRLEADPGIENAKWLPGGRGIVLPTQGCLRLFDDRGTLQRVVEVSRETRILDLSVDSRTGRLAVAVQQSWADSEGLVAGLEIRAPDGELLASIPDLTGIARLELGFESPQPTWLPDGRVAFLHRVPRAPAIRGSLRELAILDPATGRVLHTGQHAERILGAGRDGIMLVPAPEHETPAPRLYSLSRNALEEIGLPPERSFSLEAMSQDGAWIAGIEHTDAGPILGAFRLEDRTWHPIGRGALVGWDADGSLIWMH